MSVTREEEEDKCTLGASLAERETERERESERRENYVLDEEKAENEDTLKPPSHF